MKIGVAGLGKMGSAIAERLIECGHDLVVWNRSPEKVAPLTAKGAKAIAIQANLAREADVRRLFGTGRVVLPSVSRDVLAAGPDPAGLRAAADRWAEELAS